MKVWKNNEKQEMTYEEVCRDLGFTPSVNFVKVTTAGTIGFWAGKPNEIRALYKSVEEHGYMPSKALLECVGTL